MIRAFTFGAVFLVLSLLCSSTPLLGQTIRGRVLDASTSEPVGYATVTALRADQRPVLRVQSDSEGAFVLPLRTAGEYRLRVERMGFATSTSEVLRVGRRDSIEVDLVLSTSPLPLDAVVATVRSPPLRKAALERVGFYDREAVGLGRFLRREDIEQYRNTSLPQILDRLPGTTMLTNHSGSVIVFNRSVTDGMISRTQRGRASLCLPQLYLDGILVAYDVSGIERIVPPEHIEAIETYSSPAQIPVQFRSTGSSCGVIIVWTRVEP